MVIVMAREDSNSSDKEKEWLQRLLDNMRPSVFAELGRCIGETDEDAMRFWQCVAFLRDNPNISAKKAIRYIRRHRLGGGDDMDTRYALHDALVRVVNEYLERYPDLTPEHVEEALKVTLNQCKTMKVSEAASE